MASASFNRFSLLNDMVDTAKPTKNDTSSPPIKKVKKRTPVGSDSSGNRSGKKLEDGNNKRSKEKGRRKVIDRSRLDTEGTPIRPNRKLLLSDSDSSDKENKKLPEKEEVVDSTPPDIQLTTCPATNHYVKLARDNHFIPTLAQLLDRAGSFGRMFDDGAPVDCLAADLVNLDEIYGMLRPRFQERKLMWEAKASLIFFEQGLIQQLFEREKIILFFELIKKHKDRVPNLYRLYNSVYDLENPIATD